MRLCIPEHCSDFAKCPATAPSCICHWLSVTEQRVASLAGIKAGRRLSQAQWQDQRPPQRLQARLKPGPDTQMHSLRIVGAAVAGPARNNSAPQGACRLCAVKARPSTLSPCRDCDNAQHRKRNALRADQPAGAGPRGQQKLLSSAAPRSEWSAPQLGGVVPGVWGSDLAYHEGAPSCEP